MLKINLKDLRAAVLVAESIERIEAAKDHPHLRNGATVNLGDRSKENPLGFELDIMLKVPPATIRSQLEMMLADNHKLLRDLGIELVGGGSGG